VTAANFAGHAAEWALLGAMTEKSTPMITCGVSTAADLHTSTVVYVLHCVFKAEALSAHMAWLLATMSAGEVCPTNCPTNCLAFELFVVRVMNAFEGHFMAAALDNMCNQHIALHKMRFLALPAKEINLDMSACKSLIDILDENSAKWIATFSTRPRASVVAPIHCSRARFQAFYGIMKHLRMALVNA
jgi:hypothetical protein